MAKDSQTRFVSPKAWERIEHWSRRKPIFALMGEFSAGKSTLMNFLLRSYALPTQVTATQLPPVWFTWGDKSPYVQRPDGTRDTIKIEELEKVGVNDAQFVRIYLKSDILEAVDLIDTPGISDPKISTDVWQRAVGQANGVLWCTHATQAWRETERATWVSLPERLQNNSLLLVTRADALDAKDRQKVLRRVNREAGHLFNRSILFSARDAIVARDKSGDAELWARSGGGKMVDSFLEITEQIMDNRATQLGRYQVDHSQSDAPAVHPLRPKRRIQTGEQPAPLKLVDRVPNAENPFAASDVVTSFPVRPNRIERRSEGTDRAPRIDPQEAERLRAEMSINPELDDTSVEDAREDLSSFVNEGPSDPFGLPEQEENLVATAADDILAGEFEEPADNHDDLLETAKDFDPFAIPADDAALDVQDPFADETDPMGLPEAIEEEMPDEQPAEAAVSSIAALMAEHSKAAQDEFEPEADEDGLIDTQVVTLSNGPADKSAEIQNDTLETSDDQPLSAAAMWREVLEEEDLPEDPDALHQMFQTFLAEFDEISAEHAARQKGKTVHPVANGSDSTRPEWQVL